MTTFTHLVTSCCLLLSLPPIPQPSTLILPDRYLNITLPIIIIIQHWWTLLEVSFVWIYDCTKVEGLRFSFRSQSLSVPGSAIYWDDIKNPIKSFVIRFCSITVGGKAKKVWEPKDRSMPMMMILLLFLQKQNLAYMGRSEGSPDRRNTPIWRDRLWVRYTEW